MVKERWWSATDIKHRKHVKTCYLRDRVSLGFRVSVLVRVRVSLRFRDMVMFRVKGRVSFRLATFMYSVWPPVFVKVRVSLGIGFRVSLGFRVRVRVKVRVSFRLATFMYSVGYVLLYPIFLTPNPQNFSVPF